MKKSLALLAATTLAASALALPAAAAPGKPGDMTIAEIATANGNFTYLLTALDVAGLTGAVDDADDPKLTVFAPTNAAFETLAGALGLGANPAGVLDMVAFLDANDLLDDVLLYHVVDGRRFSNSVLNRNSDKMIETLSGEYFTATPSGHLIDAFAGTDVMITGTNNLNASNGVIHVIDNVLVPQAVIDAL
jgi:uncharacterized surface protein with fasciclin (FAS1) repeats